MRAWMAFVIACVGCGSKSPEPPLPPIIHSTGSGRSAGSGGPDQAAISTDPAGRPAPAAICDRVMSLQAAHCGAFGVTIVMQRPDCVEQFTRISPDPKEREFADSVARCIVDPGGCKGVTTCLSAMSKPDPQHLRGCHDKDPSLAVGVPAAEYALHNGSKLTRFSQVRSTKAAPIERCGIDNENDWLATLTCDDDSQPITDAPSAELTRIGNLGEGGRCGSIIDQYTVRCPEGAFDIYLDGYVCPQ